MGRDTCDPLRGAEAARAVREASDLTNELKSVSGNKQEAERKRKQLDSQVGELNAKLRLWTIRHSMVDQLKAPPAGLEGAVLAHFRPPRRRIFRQCWAWTEEAPVELRRKMRAAVAQLHAVLPKAE